MGYHISKNGMERACEATERACPLGGKHYATIEEARIANLKNKLAGVFTAPPTPIIDEVVANSKYNKPIPKLQDGAIPFLDRVKELASDNSADLETRELRLNQAQELLEAFLKEIDPNESAITRKGTDFNYAKFESELAEAQERANELLAHGSKEELEAFLEERVNDRRFQECLILQNNLQEEARILYKLYDVEDKIWRSRDIDPSSVVDGDYDAIRERGLAALERNDEQLIVKDMANRYKDLHAPLVAKISEFEKAEQIANGTWREYTADELPRADGSGSLTAVGDFPSGTREWLESRQTGVGGSDVGKILKVGDADYREDEYLEVLASKIEPISDAQVEQQTSGHSEFTGYAGRGNAWEDYIVAKFNKNNPDLGVTHCKTSWQDKDFPFVRANFDGLLTDENGVPDGILEIKTSSIPENWGPEEAGIDGVPAQYRKQALWYARAAGFKRGAFGVMINDNEYREYHFTMTPELKAEAEKDFQQVKSFWSMAQKMKEGTWKDSTDDYAKGFSDNAIKVMGRDGFAVRDSTLQTLAAWRDEPISQVKKEFDSRIRHLKRSDRSDNFTSESIPAVRDILDGMFKEVDRTNPKMRPFVSVDLETSGSQPARGRIIDVGIAVSHPAQDVNVKDHDSLYGIPRRVAAAAGTGREDIHGISPGMVNGITKFHNEKPQKEVLALLKEGTMVAHNALFETRWFRLHLKGFAEAEKRGEISIFDTMKAAKWFVAPAEKHGRLYNNNRLESFAETFDIRYENAHRAKPDADMTARAINRFAKALPNLPTLAPQGRTSPAERKRKNDELNKTT